MKLENTNEVLYNVHDPSDCDGRPCPLHHRTDHHMRSWPQHWRGDTQVIERLCSHGIGHPDPDQRYYFSKTRQEYLGIHGCDGCCKQTMIVLEP